MSSKACLLLPLLPGIPESIGRDLRPTKKIEIGEWAAKKTGMGSQWAAKNVYLGSTFEGV